MDSTNIKANELDFDSIDSPELISKPQNSKLITLVLPALLVVFITASFISSDYGNQAGKSKARYETKGKEIKNAGKFNILSSEDLSSGIKDTVYTDKNCWLELRIDQQMLYQHWRNGKTEKYPVSTGNNHGGDPKALESRPGLFAIFSKEEHHISSQFDAADMYNYMPFNQGIGFHSLNGTGYYGSLGIRPASHGCIRMKHEDVKKLYGECEIGTLVLATKGYSARAITFAPEGFENAKVYTKEEYKTILASNLYNILKGRYYITERPKFVVDPKIIPTSGIYTSYDVKVPEKQLIPRSYVTYFEVPDKVQVINNKEILQNESSQELVKSVNNEINNSGKKNTEETINSTDDLVRQYFHNPIGILPYFGPKK